MKYVRLRLTNNQTQKLVWTLESLLSFLININIIEVSLDIIENDMAPRLPLFNERLNVK